MAKAKYIMNSRGEYATKIWDGTYNVDGSKHRINLKSKKSSADLEKKVNTLKESVRNGHYVQLTDELFGDYAKKWLLTKKNVRSKNTKAMYANIIEKHLSILDDVKLSDIRNSHFQFVVNNAMDKPRTCQQIYITFKQIIRMAVSDNLIGAGMAENIIRDISLPKTIKTEKRPLNEVEKKAFKQCLDNNTFTDREKAFLLLIYYTGMRRGEALALTIFDFSFQPSNSHVSITKNLIFDGNDPEIKDTPKSDRGFRKIPIPDDVANYLKEYIRVQSGSQLFSCATNSMITKSSYVKMWNSIIRKLNYAAGGSDAFPVVDDLTAHIFRHNYCTNLCYKVPEISIKKIAQLMGDSEKVILNIYNHIMEEKEDVNTVLENALAM